MQAEDIIQQKEWSQLSQAEKKILFDIATTEQEFNLLKKMLQLANEEAVETPQINAVIKKHLQSAVQMNAPKIISFKKWYYAAAASLIIGFSAWLFLQKKTQTNKDFAIKHPVKENKKQNRVTIVDSNAKKHTPIKNLVKENATQVKKIKALPKINVVDSIQIPNYDPQKNIAMINTSVSKNYPLLAFVTEVY